MPKISQIDEVQCQAEVRILQKITLKGELISRKIEIVYSVMEHDMCELFLLPSMRC